MHRGITPRGALEPYFHGGLFGARRFEQRLDALGNLVDRYLRAPGPGRGHVVDFRSWTARLASGSEVTLTEREVGILRLLAEREGEVVSRDEIMDHVWGGDTFPSTRTIDNFIVRLRRHFEPDSDSPTYIHTVWGVGYRFTR